MKVCCDKIAIMLRSKLNKRIHPTPDMVSGKRIAWAKNSGKLMPGCDLNCGNSMREYLECTSLHGLKYIGFTHISLCERIFFGLSFILVLLLSIYYISNVYNKWSATPVIVTMGASSTSITDLPFPAVTICNINKARNSVVKQFPEDAFQRAMLQNICADEYDNVTVQNGKERSDWETVRELLLNFSQPCKEMLVKCRFGLETFNCMNLFDTVLTDEGLCCIFNPVEPEFLYKNPLNASSNFDTDDDDDYRVIPIDWTPERGYIDPTIKRNSTPRPAAGSGSHLGLRVTLNADISDYFCSSTDSAGFKILLHNPTETPRLADFGMLVSPGRETRIVVTPKIQTASRLIRDVPIEQRQCVFPWEAHLKYFRTYSRKNCEMECFSQAIEDACGCVIYYMPRFTQNSKVCNRSKSRCYNAVRISLERGESANYSCPCLPGCDELSFSGTVSYAPLITNHFRARSPLANFSSKAIMTDIAVVQIFYEENFFRSFVKDELIGFTEFLSNTGGLLGLFMGFSVVSMVEIIYFISLRPTCRQFDYKRDSKHTKNTSQKHQTISKLLSKNQSQIWSHTWLQDRDRMSGKSDLMLQAYTKNGQHIHASPLWKPATYLH